MYKKTDKVLLALDRKILRLFRKLRLMDFDSMNVLNEVKLIYRRADRLAKQAYLDAGMYAYIFAMEQAEKAGYKAKKKTPIDADWVLDMLEEEDFVTLYDYGNEWERKRQRLSEALTATTTPQKEIDKAIKQMAMQISHYADKATARAVIQAYRDAGVKKVMWITERDERVCGVCEPMDGKIFRIDELPGLPAHWRCRCTVLPWK